ncbi:MAG: hypothetical protein IPK79_08825 [Vampirovibrionales bacterium]|nr:hypothetical protein [Vampirovibrionales bacterium]
MTSVSGGLTQSEAYVQQLAATNPTLYKWAFGSSATSLYLGTMSSVLNNPAYTGVKSSLPVGVGAGLTDSATLPSSILSNPAYTGVVSSTMADRQAFNTKLAEFDQKYGDLFAWGANASPLAAQLTQESNLAIQREAATGIPGTVGGGLGGLGVLMGIGNLLPETPFIGAQAGYSEFFKPTL